MGSNIDLHGHYNIRFNTASLLIDLSCMLHAFLDKAREL